MSLAVVFTRASSGVEAPLVTVEAHLSNGLPAFHIVGLPETAVKESRDRVRSAIINSHFEFPSGRITVNLAPADLPKEGGRFDLAIALGILAASGQIPRESLSGFEFLGELALTGELRPIRGSLSAALASADSGRALVVPTGNGSEAALGDEGGVFTAEYLLQVSAHLHRHQSLPAAVAAAPTSTAYNYPDLNDVRGQAQAKRALEIAASGAHNLIFCGPPGTGKTMLASRLPGILPALSRAEMLEVAMIFSASKRDGKPQISSRPFRNPHHTASAVALVGGGSQPRPGEISLAHRGVLFLDELPEFQRQVLEVLREPLESGEIMISRAKQQVRFPAHFQLVAAMNPCPCGYFGDSDRACRCSPDHIRRYRNKISGPLLDRIDLQLALSRLPTEAIRQASATIEPSAIVRERVLLARQLQLDRQGKTNASLTIKQLEQFCSLSGERQLLLESAVNRLKLSPRAYHRILRVARTIADMAQKLAIEDSHLLEAIGYRALDRESL